MSDRSRWIVPIALGAAGIAYVNGRLRPRGDDAEPLPGDELLPDAEIVETHETVLQAPVADVWPWLVQMGYGRGGFYSFDVLERLAGVSISNADVINPAWQNLTEGEVVHLAEEVAWWSCVRSRSAAWSCHPRAAVRPLRQVWISTSLGHSSSPRRDCMPAV
ncbi:hypothetical protein [Actinomyces ruminis]|nr:hypothetical protein [Actinomyces ruminis]